MDDVQTTAPRRLSLKIFKLRFLFTVAELFTRILKSRTKSALRKISDTFHSLGEARGG